MTNPPSKTYPELAAALRAVTDGVCDRHTSLSQQTIGLLVPPSVSGPDDLRMMLGILAQCLSTAGVVAPLELLGPGEAMAREAHCFGLEEIFREHGLLRGVLLNQVESHLARVLSTDELRALQSATEAILVLTVVRVVGHREAQAKLESTALSHSLTSLSHDLRNELNGVLIFMQVLEEAGQDLRDAVPRLATPESPATGDRFEQLTKVISASRRAMELTIAAMTRLLEAERLRNRVASARGTIH